MAKFKYKAIKEMTKDFIEGEIEAIDEREAREKIRELGFLPTKVFFAKTDFNESFEKKTTTVEDDSTYINRLSLDEKIQFTSELEVLLSSQIPIIAALNMLEDSIPNIKLKRLSKGLKKSIEKGSTLKEAFEQYKNVFDPVFIGLITAGEMSGNISETFGRLNGLQNKQKAIKEKLISASIYPAIVIVIMIGVLALFGGFVLPRLFGLYIDAGAELPFMAEMIYGFIKFMAHSWLLVLIGGIGAGYGLFKTFQLAPIKKYFEKLVLELPLVGNFAKMINLSNFIAVLQIAYDAGIPISSAVEMASTTIKNHVIKQQSDKVVKSLNKGHTLYDAFNMSHILDRSYMNLILTGEKSGELGKMLNQLADLFDKKTDMVITALAKSFEPALIIILGIAVGILLLAFMPMLMGGIPVNF